MLNELLGNRITLVCLILELMTSINFLSVFSLMHLTFDSGQYQGQGEEENQLFSTNQWKDLLLSNLHLEPLLPNTLSRHLMRRRSMIVRATFRCPKFFPQLSPKHHPINNNQQQQINYIRWHRSEGAVRYTAKTPQKIHVTGLCVRELTWVCGWASALVFESWRQGCQVVGQVFLYCALCC